MTAETHAPQRCAESALMTRASQLATAAAPEHVRMREIAFHTQLDLRVDRASPTADRIGSALGVALPDRTGVVVESAELAALSLGPDEWLLLAPAGEAERLQDAVCEAQGADFGSVTDVSCHRTMIEVVGPSARELLAKGCAIDLHPRSFGQGQCVQTMVARTQVVLICRDADAPVFQLLVRSSFARYLADWLTDAVAEYGGTP